MGTPGKPDDDVRQAILGHAAAGVIAPTGTLTQAEFGRYIVVASIGKGGMGEVYLARTKGTPHGAGLVALKVLLDEVDEDGQGRDEELIGMFMDEASIMAQIHHPNVLSVFDFGREKDNYYLAMEYLMGRPLVRVMIDAYTKEEGLESGLIAAIGADAARGLHAAHIAKSKNGQPLKVVHRDVSPQNIFITFEGLSKVIDFGVARASERVSHTSAGQLKGKAAYMSPEQINGYEIDGRSDVFALGTCLWEMAAGRRLFKRESDYETMAAVLEAEIRPPSGFRPAVDKELDEIILDSLERDRKRRIQDAGSLADRLIAFATKKGYDTRGRDVKALLDRLYSGVAAEERELIKGLEERAATEAEVDALRQLSGIAPRGSMRLGVTLAANPAELAELDDFGRIEDVKTVAVNTSKLIAASRLASELRKTPPSVRQPDLPTPEERAEAIRRAVEALQAEHQAALTGGRSANVLKGKSDSRAKSLLPLAIIAGILVIGIIAVLLSSPEPAPIEVDEPKPASESSETIRLDEPIEVPEPADAPRPADAVVPNLAERGIDVARLGTKIALEDSQGSGPVSIDAGALFTKVDVGGVEGWLANSQALEATSVVWIGGRGGRPWRVRGLSINDCPATGSLHTTGIEITYANKRVLLPHGGGSLERRQLTRPSFAERMELIPFGLAFGKPIPGREAKLCPSGWNNDQIRIERIPPGSYKIRWMGGDRVDEVPFDVEASPILPKPR